MLWHAIFVEHSVVPQISEPALSGAALERVRPAPRRSRRPPRRRTRRPTGSWRPRGPRSIPGFRSTPAPARRPASPAAPNRSRLRPALRPVRKPARNASPTPVGSVWLVSGTTPTWMVVPSRSTMSTPLAPSVVTRSSTFLQNVGLRPAGLVQQQLPLVVVGEQVGGTVDQLVDLVPGQAGAAAGRGRRRRPGRACGTPRCAPPSRRGRWPR